RIWLQQIALGGVCTGGVSDGLFEDTLSGGVYGGAADVGNFQAGKCGEVHQGMPGAGDSGRAAGCAVQRCGLYAAWEVDPVWADGNQECGAERDRFDSGGAGGACCGREELCIVLGVLREG